MMRALLLLLLLAASCGRHQEDNVVVTRTPALETIDQYQAHIRRTGVLSISDIRRASPEFFHPDAIRFFISRVGTELFYTTGPVLFVTSERDRGGPRAFTVRAFDPVTCVISPFSLFQQFPTRPQALTFARRAARESWQARLGYTVRL